jgi:hypothetical protein
MRKTVGCGLLLRLAPLGAFSGSAEINDLTGLFLIQRSPHVSTRVAANEVGHVRVGGTSVLPTG